MSNEALLGGVIIQMVAAYYLYMICDKKVATPVLLPTVEPTKAVDTSPDDPPPVPTPKKEEEKSIEWSRLQTRLRELKRAYAKERQAKQSGAWQQAFGESLEAGMDRESQIYRQIQQTVEMLKKTS